MAYKFSPSVNLSRDAETEISYFPTANAQRVYLQILNDFALGVHSFSIIGSYGTGKSAFLVAFEQTLRRQHTHFQNPNGHFGGAHEFEFINIVGGYASIEQVLAERLGAPTVEEIWPVLNDRHAALHKRNGCLVIAIDEFGKFLEYAAHTNPDKELYFVQQLAEYVNDASKNIVLLVTLHQSFSTYSDGLNRKQREEWEKVKGRLKELTFNEPVEQLLTLAAEQLNPDTPVAIADDLTQLVEAIGQSLAFPHRRKLSIEFASRLLPFDLLAASILTQALQWYGQNERSLFTFLYANDHLGIRGYDHQRHRYYNLVCVYEYLLHNYYSVLSSAHNPHYLQWGAIRSAIERVEAMFTGHISEALSLVKIIGLLNIFAPQGAKINEHFLMDYARLTLGIQDVPAVLTELETHKIVRYVRFKDSFILFEGTDLNIELALLEASSKVEPIRDVTSLLRKYFAFPIVLAKAVSYQTGTPRFFEYRLSKEPILALPEGGTDGTINLIFGETLELDTLLSLSQTHGFGILHGWYRHIGQIREILYEIEKIDFVSNSHSDDRVAVRELHKLKNHEVERLNQQVLRGMYATEQPVM